LIPRTGFAQAAQTAQTARPVTKSPRVFVDVNVFGAGSAQSDRRVFTGRFIKFGEIGTIVATYPHPSHAAIVPVDVSGGFFLNRWLAVGAGFSRSSYSDEADLVATVPNPTILFAPSVGSVSTGTLQRTESAIHIFGTLVLLRKAHVEWRVSGGPSLFRYDADMVQDVTYTQDAIPNLPGGLVTIVGITDTTVQGNGFGGHLSSDVAYFFSRQMAITGVVRFSSAIVTLNPEPLSLLQQRMRVGSTSFLLGVRFHFGNR
jgi:hypothetical protein